MERYDVFYSKQAVADLERVWDEVFAASADFDIADNYVTGIRNAVKKFDSSPKAGVPLIYENIFTGIYMVIYKKYLAFYRVRETRMEVGRILFGASDYMGVVLNSLNNDLKSDL